jgi:esterase/lipase superfamily enzyme
MPKFWMISNRNIEDGGFGTKRDVLTFWYSEQGPLDNFANWKKTDRDNFKQQLISTADSFPSIEHGQNENQSQVSFFIHGYNNTWQDAARRYEKFCGDLFSGNESLGLCISFDWPSCGSVLEYLPDRFHARDCANDLVEVLSELYDWLIKKQAAAYINQNSACKAKVSVVSHSMGNYLLQKAMSSAWTRKNQPLLVSLINQLVMIAADIDNDLFEDSSDDGTDGDAVANLTYRITALYSGRDAVLGDSAGLKHFGTRRLGRSGLAKYPPTGKDNVWQVDCSNYFPGDVGGMSIHSAYFEHSGTLDLIKQILRGIDRTVLLKQINLVGIN